MNRREIVLAALAGSGPNSHFTPVQVQKLFFLIDQEVGPLVGGPHFNFVPYDYGPFDRLVYEEIEGLSREGLANISLDGRYRKFSLSRSGFIAGSSALERIPANARKFVCEAADWVRALNFDQLVAAIYNKYPEMKKNSVFIQ